MIKAFYTGVSGSLANQSKLNVISNNMANVNTEGFKKSKAEFADLMHNSIRGDSTGSGSKIAKVDVVFNQGAPIQTGNETDFAINGDGFFGIDLGEDGIAFTRAGSFEDTLTEDGRYLTYGGGYVLDSNEEPIEIEEFKNGEVIPAVFEFENNGDLEQIGGNLFKASEDTEYMVVEEDRLLQGFLESSTVDIAEEMVNIIETQRAFQLNSNIIKTADEIEQTINSLRN